MFFKKSAAEQLSNAQLSAHFTMREAIASTTADERGIDNTPPDDLVDTLRLVAHDMEIIRNHCGNLPIIVSSWYRCEMLNDAVGGVGDSKHCSGMAVDFTCPRLGDPEKLFDHLRRRKIGYDKLILEFGAWVHVQWRYGDQQPRRKAYSIDTPESGFVLIPDNSPSPWETPEAKAAFTNGIRRYFKHSHAPLTLA